MLSNWKICFNVFNIRTEDEIILIRMQLMKLYKERPGLTSQFDISQVQKQPSSVIQVHLDQCANFGPLNLNVCVTVSSSINS